MTLRLTPARLAAAYECLRAFPPFCRMSLPPASEVTFKVLKTRALHGQHTHLYRSRRQYIDISEGKVGHLDSLMLTMAHEMIHAYQALSKTETAHTGHNAQFHNIAANVCNYFGWDPRGF